MCCSEFAGEVSCCADPGDLCSDDGDVELVDRRQRVHGGLVLLWFCAGRHPLCRAGSAGATTLRTTFSENWCELLS